MKSLRKVTPFPEVSYRTGMEDTSFLPAALEIVETPASPTGRALAATLIVIFCFSLAWASFGHLDIVATAYGKIVPSGGTKVIQPFEAGIVRSIHVHDGERVVAGQTLIELDPTINESDRNHVQADLTSSRLEIARLKAGLADKENPVDAFFPPSEATPAQVEMEQDYLIKQTTEYRAKMEVLDRQLDQKQAERSTIQATVGKLSAIVPIVQERVNIRKASSDQEYTSRFQYLEMLQLLVEQQQELIVQRSKLTEIDANIAALTDARRQAVAEFHRTLFGQLVEAQRKAEGLSYDVAKSDQKIRAQYLKAPIDGTVQQLSIHTVGGVVTPAQVLMAVVPLTSHLEIEAFLPNRDVGFVHPRQQAAIKVDTFNFTKYGLLHGEVLSVSQDAVVRDTSGGESRAKNPAANSASSEQNGQELNFATRVSLDRSQMRIDDKLVSLTPGMAVTVEIKTGSRTVMGYLLSPLVKYGHDSLRER